jgi:hypothetical protein
LRNNIFFMEDRMNIHKNAALTPKSRGEVAKAWEGEGPCAITDTCEVQTKNQLRAQDHSAANRRLRNLGSGPACAIDN